MNFYFYLFLISNLLPGTHYPPHLLLRIILCVSVFVQCSLTTVACIHPDVSMYHIALPIPLSTWGLFLNIMISALAFLNE